MSRRSESRHRADRVAALLRVKWWKLDHGDLLDYLDDCRTWASRVMGERRELERLIAGAEKQHRALLERVGEAAKYADISSDSA